MTEEHEPFGTLLGYAPGGVAIYSSNYSSIPDLGERDDISFRSYINNEYMGYKWQCVEFARRFLYLNYGVVFTDVSMAYEIFALRFLRHVVDDGILPLRAYQNGSQMKPTAGSLLIWAEGGEFEHTGHVAIITQVFDNKVRVVEQNVLHHKLPAGQQWTRELPLNTDNGSYTLSDTFTDTTILGWMIQTDNNQYAYKEPEINPQLMELHAAQLDSQVNFNQRWLDESNPIELAYVKANHGHKLSANPHEYFTISSTAENQLMQATNEVHLMYLHATEKVLKDDNLLKLFNIPEILWPRLRLSWQNRRHDMVTGRLDFCMDHRGLKVYEYNADSASCHTETGLIIDKWSKVGGINAGWNPGERLQELLTDTWKHTTAKPFIHIMQDRDSEEDYHALFMAQSIKAAGFECKIIHGLDELVWNETGQVVDGEGQVLQCVWKTWAWETALEQLRQESESDLSGLPIRTGHPHHNDVRLIDVLLRPEIRVFEPLWTVIPGNKSILPILWSLFPHHPYLLDTDFEINDELRQTGYAVKPIAGRCGNNIGLVDHQDDILDETCGQFAHQENVYQQLWCLPKVAERYIQVCTFTVGGHYGGACLRSDPSLVIKKDSDIEPLWVLDDDDYLKQNQ
ncbi:MULTISPECIES: bifunctional glutathionylspermidine amidase/synthase [unclassified Providencia]|uniref:bifunctional glutathionylspermidine amidase/synthase n=1 Tax=unclassified Providencia TaxID=2633465 RepID=UPI0012B54CA2|nr:MULTISPECIES: bifunctional glutathionylspermidine amidase/synthase [unclassified Providencia]MTB47292.1 bifunctional glutathionylspermidine amidase/synthase [Providencia sp. wls1950]MTC21577.1 bifunctional glutathionylspermidine amidase/synthase [Providencia sp. wls1938]MTC41286.1 bifunctional glutathionylspermidine amidase/synthase [Providencia sp. wls1921]MTC45317.1 bifunctional glutathionylspermidine amidase/synthase [Providencia sp. wls1922]